MTSNTRSACQPQWLDSFWKDELSEDQLKQFEQHLCVCELCQSHFDEYVGSQPVTETLAESRNELCTRINQPRILLQRHDEEQLDSLCQLAKRLFPPAAEDSVEGRSKQSSKEDVLRPNQEVLGTIDHFDLLEPIGSGGMGFVYKAYDRRLHRLVAVKVLSPNVATTGAARQRFTREAQAAANITSPHVVPIHTVSQFEGLPYLVMSLIDGPDLQRWVLEHGPLPILNSLRIACQVASGLQAAHEKGVIHRDVKPANILLQPSILQATLTDFGLAIVGDEAALTHSGMTLGTPSFMSPEQARGETIDQRSDWYSFGCVLYTMLVGHPPFRGPHPMAVLTSLQQDQPKPPSDHRHEIPQWLDQLVMHLLQRDADSRMGDGEKIVSWLKSCIAHLEHPKHYDLPNDLIADHKPNVRKRVYFVTAGLLICLIVSPLFMNIKSFAPKVTQPRISVENHETNDHRTELLDAKTDQSQTDQRIVTEAQVQLRLNESEMRESELDQQLNEIESAIFQLESEL